MNRIVWLGVLCAVPALARELTFTPADAPDRILARVRAERAAHPGEPLTVRLVEGRYVLDETLVFTPADSGSPEAPVVWRGTGRGAFFSARVPLKGWTPKGNGVWAAPIPSGKDGTRMWFETLYVNGTPRVRAAYPDTGFFKATNVVERLLAKPRRPWDYSVPSENTFWLSDADFAVLADLPEEERPFAQMQLHTKWAVTRRPVLSVDPAAKTFRTNARAWPRWNRFKADENPIRFENVRAAFDSPGEWFYDAKAGEILYRPRPGETMSACDVWVPRGGLETLVSFAGDVPAERLVTDLRFENIGFGENDTGCGNAPSDYVPNLESCLCTTAAVIADGTRRLVFDGCRWERTGTYGAWFRDGCRSNAVVNSAFTDLGAGGIRIGNNAGVKELTESAPTGAVAHATFVPHSTAFITVENNLFARGGRRHPSSAAVFLTHASDCRVVHNDIHDFYYTGISVGWVFGYRGSCAQRNEISFNHIWKLGQGILSDLAGVYTLAASFGTVVSNNVIHDVDCLVYGGWGLYTDEGSEGIVFENNLVYDTEDGSVHQHFGRNNIYRNNIFAFSDRGQVHVTRAEKHRSMTVERNLILWEGGDAFFEKYRGTKTEKSIIDWIGNLWWRTDGKPVFNGKTFEAWQAKGNDVQGLAADPGFVDAAARDFRLKPDSPAAKIGFKPFDFTRAGRYSGRARVRFAPMPPQEAEPVPPADVKRWRAKVTGSESHCRLFPSGLIARKLDDVPVPVKATAQGRAWLTAELVAEVERAPVVVNRVTRPEQCDHVLFTSPHGAYVSGTSYGGCGALWRLGATRAADPALHVKVGAGVTAAAARRSTRPNVGFLDLKNGPIRGTYCVTNVAAWRAACSGAARAAGKTFVPLTTPAEIRAAEKTGTFAVILNPYGETFPASSSDVRFDLRALRDYVRKGGHWIETGGAPFIRALIPVPPDTSRP